MDIRKVISAVKKGILLPASFLQSFLSRFKVSFKKTSFFALVLFLFTFILLLLQSHNFPWALNELFRLLLTNAIIALVAVVVKRIILTRWGNFLHGFILILILECLSVILIRLAGIKTPLFTLILLGLGLYLYILFDDFIHFFLPGEKQEKRTGTNLNSLFKPVASFLAALPGSIKNISSLAYGKIKEKVNINLFFIPIMVLLLLLVLYSVFINLFAVRVVMWSPEGLVPFRTTISMKFSGPVTPLPEDVDIVSPTDRTNTVMTASVTSNLIFIKPSVKYFEITPPLKGVYRIEDRDRIIFVPDGQLSPSTRYRVKLLTSRLRASKKFIRGRIIRFNTPEFMVTGVNLFYNMDILKNVEKEVVAEVNFNADVDIAELKKYITLRFDSEEVTASIEPSNIPTRFYLKSSRVTRGEEDTWINLKIAKNLPCIGGAIPLKKDFTKAIILPKKVRLAVTSVEAFPVAGTTYIAVLFNRPVSPSMVKRYIRIEPQFDNGAIKELPFNADTEYCYAVLKADFKPNMEYKVVIYPGIAAKTGEVLKEEYSRTVQIKDIQPEVRFTSGGSILPLGGNMDIELFTVNLDKFNVNIEKVFRNNFIHFLKNQSPEFCKNILYKSVDVEKGQLNERVLHYINLKNFYDMEYKGLFRIKISDPKEYYNYNDKLVLCTDLGLIAKHSGNDLIINVYSVKNLLPQSDVQVKLVSYENQVIQEAITDPNGACVLKDWKVNRYNFSPFLILAEKGEDFSYLKFSESEINQSRFNVDGDPFTMEGMEAFLTPERGVYRPGDKAFITAIVRNKDMSLAQAIDVHLYVSDPQGEKFTVIRKRIPGNGMMSFEIPFPSYARTGEYFIQLRLNENVVLGRTSLKVEEFMPDKIKVEVNVPKKRTAPGQAVEFTVKGIQLFGPPAAGNKVFTDVNFISMLFTHPRFSDYTFNDPDRSYSDQRVSSGEEHLDEKGEKQYIIDIPSQIMPPSALMAQVYTEVYDVGGRPVSAVKTIPVNRYSVYYGLSTGRKDVFVTGQPVRINYTAIDPDGNYKYMTNVRLLVKRRVYYTILRRYGIFRSGYESESYEEVLIHKDINVNGKGSFTFTPGQAGQYYIYFGREEAMRTGIVMNVQGPGMMAMDIEKARTLTLEFNKEKYQAGESALVNVYSSIPGRLFLTVEREKVLYTYTAMLVNNKAALQLPVRSDYLPNVYVSALVVRPPDAGLKDLPASAFAIRSLNIDPADREMKFDITSLSEVRSRDGLDVTLQVPAASAYAGVVLFAVDEGILQITGFRTPKPFDFFYRKRGLTTQTFSIFDFVLPDVKAPQLAIGGDEENYMVARKHLNPVAAKRVRSIALYSGVLYPDTTGTVRYHFNIPEFNGSLRVMALAADNMRFGSSSKDVIVSDPLVITPSFPRVLAPKDDFEIPVNVYNKTGKKGTFRITLNTDGPVRIKGEKTQTVTIGNAAEKKIYYYGQAENEAGKAVFTISGEGNDETVKTTTELGVRPVNPVSTEARYGALGQGKETSINIPGGFIRFGQKVRLSLSPFFVSQYLRGLDYLIHYPYGCAEQTTSTVFPLLYLKNLALLTGAFPGRSEAIDYFIKEGIKKLENMQMPDGHFCYWPGGNYYNEYTSHYVSHFLLEAERMGYDVDDQVIRKIGNTLGAGSSSKKAKLDRRDEYNGQETDLYILYLKSLIGKPDFETMEYLRINKLKEMSYVDRCRLSSCYALIGDKKTALQILPLKFLVEYFPRYTGGDFDSLVRRLSLYLMALCEADPRASQRMDIVKQITKYSRDGYFGTTQDNMFALMAISKAFESQQENEIKADLYLNGKLYRSIAGRSSSFEDNALSGKTLSLKNEGQDTLYYNLLTEGTFLDKKLADENSGMVITRRYYNKNGRDLNLSAVVQGELVVATISLDIKENNIDNIVIVDIVPAGFEIENPRLRSRGSLDFDPDYSWNPVYQDIRDDRLLLFSGNLGEGVHTFSYTLRAVTVGEFAIPQAYAEAMYNPDLFSRSRDQGRVNIVRGQ
ncbi:MAG: MG2 domain-containing protein [bacterium]|nr:MG2 domain-containing protein [bacterium]